MPLLERKHGGLLPQLHPVMQDFRNLQVITSYFNPCGYRRLRDNYWRFREALEAPLHTIELLFGECEPEIPDAVHVTSNAVLWHKESLLNILIDRMPAEVDAIAWIDADVLFQNPRWVQQTCEALRDHAVVQLFGKSYHLMPDGVLRPYKQSCGKLWVARNKYWSNFAFATPGFAWAARADWLKRHKLSDIHVIGGGDTFMMCAFTGRPLYMQSRMNEAYRSEHLKWVRQVQPEIGNSFGCISGDIHHLWHGRKEDRRYVVRYEDLANFQPLSDLRRDASGLWEWTDAADPLMVTAVANHFQLRNEDVEYREDVYDGLADDQVETLAHVSR